MKQGFNDFVYNLKMYLKYITKVGFKELFIDVLILVCLAVIASFVYLPIGLLRDLIRSLFITFVQFNAVIGSIYNWIFNVISAIVSLIAFGYLFNMRYDFKNDKVVPVEGTYTLERKDEINLKKDENKKEDESKVDLPKQKGEK